MRPSHCLLLVPVALVTLFAASAGAKLTGSGGSVEFTAVGPAGLKITGRGKGVAASEEGSNVVVTVPLTTLSTGIGLRDAHMRDKYLETAKYPNAILSVPRTALSLPAGGSGDAAGTLTLHGKQRPVKVHYEAKKQGAGYAVTGTTRIDMTAFGIEQPSFAGATVKPDVDITVSFTANDS